MSCLPGNFHSSSTCRSTYALPYVVDHNNIPPNPSLTPYPLLFPPHTRTPSPISPPQIPAIARTSVSIVEISSPEGPSIHSDTVLSFPLPPRSITSATRSYYLLYLSDLLSRHVNKCHPNEKPLVSSAPSRRKGTASASRATTSKQACDQCVQSTLPCDGANPCCKSLLNTSSPNTCSSMIYPFRSQPSACTERRGAPMSNSIARLHLWVRAIQPVLLTTLQTPPTHLSALSLQGRTNIASRTLSSSLVMARL